MKKAAKKNEGRAGGKLRLDAPAGKFVYLSMKKIRPEVAQRLHVFAARRNATIEYALDLVLRVGLDEYDAEDGVK